MRESWLIQRLDKPYGGKGDNPFSFGGGLHNGGLSDEAMSLLRGLLEPAVGLPRPPSDALLDLRPPLVAGDDEDRCGPLWLRCVLLAPVRRDLLERDRERPGGVVLGVRGDGGERLSDSAELELRRAHVVERPDATRLEAVLRPPTPDPYPIRTTGWLELDNGFLFFTDETMFCDTARLFGVKESLDA